MDYLIYIGDGSALPDVPARNLSKEEAEKFGVDFLLASRLYRRAEAPKKAKQSEVNDDRNSS